MPRVGSSIMKIWGFLSSHFPKMTFCWFPPERLAIISSGPMHLVCMILISLAVAFTILVLERATPDLYCSRLAMVVLNVRSPFKNSPLALRSSVIMAKPCSMASLALLKFMRRLLKYTRPAALVRTPNMVSRSSVRPAPTRPYRPKISPCRTSKVMSCRWGSNLVDRCCTDRITSPGVLSTGGNRLSRERPTMAVISSFMLVSLELLVITRFPSRRTEISSQISKISSIL